MAIKDLQPRQGFDLIEGEITGKGEVREFQKFGKPGRVCTAVIKDESSQCNFSLWNDEIDQVNVGDKVKITDGYANEWQGEIQISAGRNGKIEIIGKSEESKPEADQDEEKPDVEDKAEEESLPEEKSEDIVEEIIEDDKI